jgi:hypothetical protein
MKTLVGYLVEYEVVFNRRHYCLHVVYGGWRTEQDAATLLPLALGGDTRIYMLLGRAPPILHDICILSIGLILQLTQIIQRHRLI